MNLIKKIYAVRRILKQADKHVAEFQFHSKLICVPNCCLCCTKPDIDATIIEFLPAAYELFLNGRYDKILDRIEEKENTFCVFYNPLSEKGFCSHYRVRGLICRLFGFSVKTDKNGERTLATCRPLKQRAYYSSAMDKLSYAPEMSHYYLHLFGIDPGLTIQYHPINQSIKKALEIVLHHFQYRKKRA